MTHYFDASFGWAHMTPANLKRAGASGVIMYAGCDYTAKNVGRAVVQDLIAAGYSVGLVIENFEADLAKGADEGDRLGRNIVAAAKSLGYDYEHCVLYAAADFNSRSAADLAGIDAAMRAFGKHVPHPGLYANSYALDRCAESGSAEYFWQSNSVSFSNGTSKHAHFQQRYNDRRAHGLPVDVNDVVRTPLGLMGEKAVHVALTEDEIKAVAASVWAYQTKSGETTASASAWLHGARHDAAVAVAQIKAGQELAAAQLARTAALQASVAAIGKAVDALHGIASSSTAVADAVVKSIKSLTWKAN